MCRWLGLKQSVEAIHACLLLHGWTGYGTDLPFVQRLNDAMGLEVGDGTPEIMKAIIAGEAFGRQFSSYKQTTVTRVWLRDMFVTSTPSRLSSYAARR